MSDEEFNPQDVQTPGTPAPDEPGEIGWHANADSPDVDLSLPAPGSGGATAHVPGDEPAGEVADSPYEAPGEVVDSPEVTEPEVTRLEDAGVVDHAAEVAHEDVAEIAEASAELAAPDYAETVEEPPAS